MGTKIGMSEQPTRTRASIEIEKELDNVSEACSTSMAEKTQPASMPTFQGYSENAVVADARRATAIWIVLGVSSHHKVNGNFTALTINRPMSVIVRHLLQQRQRPSRRRLSVSLVQLKASAQPGTNQL